MLSEKTIKDFLADVAAASPVPGGGSVSALCGAEAASLALMACSLTLKNPRYGDHHAELGGVIRELEDLRDKLLELIDSDAEAYAGVVLALSRPQASPEEKEQRKQALEMAVNRAAVVPLTTAQRCLEVLRLLVGVVGKINPQVITDLGVAVKLGVVGLEGALLNVRINLKDLISDIALELQMSVDQVDHEKQALYGILNEQVEKIILRSI